ncbi:hypothetical protein ACROYT_G028191 [Oculina patagonica]
MARVSGFVVIIGLLFLVEIERNSGLPTKREANDFEEYQDVLNEKERENIRRILMLAAKELEDGDVIQVLKKSLILRLKICFSSPLPTPPPVQVLPAEGFGDERDEEVTPEQKHRLRSVLMEALERIDEEEILDFLKASLYFRLKFCLHTPFVPGPFPEPPPSPEPSQGPDTTPRPPSTTMTTPKPKPPPTTPEEQMPATRPSSSSPAPSTNPTRGENTTWTERDTPDLPDEAIENALASISRRNEIPAPRVDDTPPDQLTRDDFEVPINGQDPAEPPAELEGLEDKLDHEKESLAESASDNDDFAKLAESLLNGKESTAIEETDDGNDELIDTASDKVGKAAVRAETESVEILTANSDEGEFDSVIRIDYDALQEEEGETGTGGVDLGPIMEPNEQLSL